MPDITSESIYFGKRWAIKQQKNVVVSRRLRICIQCSGALGRLFQYHTQQCHFRVQPILCLAEICCPRIAVYFHGDLIEAGKRMHDYGIGFH